MLSSTAINSKIIARLISSPDSHAASLACRLDSMAERTTEPEKYESPKNGLTLPSAAPARRHRADSGAIAVRQCVCVSRRTE